MSVNRFFPRGPTRVPAGTSRGANSPVGNSLREWADRGAAIQKHTQSRADVIADDRSDLRAPSWYFHTIDRHAHGPVIAAQVARMRSGRQVHPLADIAVAEEPIVVFVRIPQNDAAFDLAADPTVGAEGCAAPDLRP